MLYLSSFIRFLLVVAVLSYQSARKDLQQTEMDGHISLCMCVCGGGGGGGGIMKSHKEIIFYYASQEL